jgi:hypothetical protein
VEGEGFPIGSRTFDATWENCHKMEGILNNRKKNKNSKMKEFQK